MLGCCVVVLALASIGPVRGSKDLWAYAMYGRIQSVHDGDPYGTGPRTYAQDPYLARMNPIWTGTRSVYGPVFNEYAAAVTRITGDSADATRIAFKGTAALCVLASLLLLLRRRDRSHGGRLRRAAPRHRALRGGGWAQRRGGRLGGARRGAARHLGADRGGPGWCSPRRRS